MIRGIFVVSVLSLAALLTVTALAQTPSKSVQPTAVAETKLLMQGMAAANFHGLEKIFQNKPAESKYWVFARGQALLIAECGNLLMLRPPRSGGEAVWLEHAADLRKNASQLVYKIAEQNYADTRAGIIQLANSCNRCHQSFQVSVRITPFEKRD